MIDMMVALQSAKAPIRCAVDLRPFVGVTVLGTAGSAVPRRSFEDGPRQDRRL